MQSYIMNAASMKAANNKILLLLLSFIVPGLGLSAVESFSNILKSATYFATARYSSNCLAFGKLTNHLLRMSTLSESTPPPPFVLKPSETALVLIEYQNEFTTEGGKLHGAVKEVMELTQMLPNTVRMTDAARAAGCAIIHCPISFEPVSRLCTPLLKFLEYSPLTLNSCSSASDHGA
jgi:hypothetical protein